MRDDEAATAAGAIGALVHRAVDGDEQATHDLLAHVHPLALRYCRTRLSRLPGDARHFVEDLAQEVCVAVLLALPRYKDTGRPFEAFVFAIAAHKVADLQRAAMRHPGSTAVPSDEMPERPDDSLGPEERALLSSDAEWAKKLLANLPENQREAAPAADRGGVDGGGDGSDVGNVTRCGACCPAPGAEQAAGTGRAVVRPCLNRRPVDSVRTYEAWSHQEPWNLMTSLPVSMDIRTDQGHLGKVS